jgi:hypothetical protein
VATLSDTSTTQLQLGYGCIPNQIIYQAQQQQCPECVNCGSEGCPPTCSSSCPWKQFAGSTTYSCACGDTYTSSTYKPATGAGFYPSPPQVSYPTEWTSDQFLGSGICPAATGGDNDTNNYFYQTPALYYLNASYVPLYEPKYSGGLENLINLQEDWMSSGAKNQMTFHFFGVLIMPWDSEELYTSIDAPHPLQKATPPFDKVPAFYNKGYYQAPYRDYYYNGALRTNKTPLTVASNQQTFAISRRQFLERSGTSHVSS